MNSHSGKHVWGRRAFLGTGAAALTGLLFRSFSHAVHVQAKTSLPKEVRIVDFTNNGQRQQVETVPTISKSEAEWQQQLSPIAFDVTRHEGTERPYTGPNWDQHGKGLYRCVCCDTALFLSDLKFESGTGWPSFWQPIAKENVRESSDATLGIERTAVSCARCDAHLGHVFDDGPRPTGLRYCMNGVAMTFDKAV